MSYDPHVQNINNHLSVFLDDTGKILIGGDDGEDAATIRAYPHEIEKLVDALRECKRFAKSLD